MSGCILLSLFRLDPDEYLAIPTISTICNEPSVSKTWSTSQDVLLMTSYKTYRLYILHNFPKTTIIPQNSANKLT